ncbi:hypothetical protein TcWFU_005782 [Taenia crassiceps]|uniref:Armadillo repeat-containing domain-containing protein n=1 Tax=Taenia crassiceps TaxID=6207 RepID=A0ABR4QR89_9CEST
MQCCSFSDLTYNLMCSLKMSQIRVYILGLFGAAVAALGFFAIYRQSAHVSLRRKAKNGVPRNATNYHKISPNQSVQLDLSPCLKKDDSENRVSAEEIKHLMSLLPASNNEKFFRIMKTFVQLSNYNENIVFSRLLIFLQSLRLGQQQSWLSFVHCCIWASDGFVAGLRKIFSEKNEVILLKSTKFLCNMYQGICIQGRRQFSQESIFKALISAKGHLTLQATLFLSQAGPESEKFANAQHLLRVLVDC